MNLPPIQRVHLSNGLPLMLMEKHALPLIQITLVARAGSVRDPAGKEGLASMTAALMTKGAGARSALEVAEEVDYLGASLSSQAGRHSSSVSLFTTRGRFERALALMADVVVRPTFPDSELARERNSRLTTVLQWRSTPEVLADLALDRMIFGEDHPYGRPVLGTAAGMAALGRDDLVAFHTRFFHAGNVGLIVVGDITLSELQPLLEGAFGSWGRGEEVPGNVKAVSNGSRRRIVILDHEGAPQTQIRVGCVGAPRVSDEYYALVVLNTVLGGSFASRLNTNIREVHGYGYGAGSEFDFRLLPGPFVVWSAVETGATDSALVEIFRELERMREPVAEDELQRAKNYVALGYPAAFQTVTSTALQLDEIATYGLPAEYIDRYVENVLAVSSTDVEGAARQYLDPESMTVVLVGDQRQIEGPVRALGLGPLEIQHVEDLLGPAPTIPSGTVSGHGK
jgi:predicted Zn-dependent peptidase